VDNSFEEDLCIYLRENYEYVEGKLRIRFHKYPKRINTILKGSRSKCKGRTMGVTVSIKGKVYWEHRIIFLYHHGYLPEFIDHKNRDPEDNRIDNLRPATKVENARNRSIRKDKKFKGVYFRKDMSKYEVRIHGENGTEILGFFKTEIEGASAYDTRAREMFGSFACTNF